MNSILLAGCLVAGVAIIGAAATERAEKTAKVAVYVAPHDRIGLWEEGKVPGVVKGEDTYTDPTEPTLDCYAAEEPATGAAVVILPGGGYTHLAGSYEGADLAEIFAKAHVAAFVLRYRHAPRYAYPIPMMDAERAMRVVRSKASEFKIDVKRVGICGFSAGGHLAATLSTQGDGLPKEEVVDAVDGLSARPNFSMLIYPVITMTEEGLTHTGSRKALVGDDKVLAEKMSAELHVTKETAPAFIVHAAPDTTVPVENSLMYFAALKKAGVSAELHVFAQGKHGFGVAAKDPVLGQWPEMAVKWMVKSGWAAAKAE